MKNKNTNSAQDDWVSKLVGIVNKLRAPDGCPWDREQTHHSLKQYLMEECAELLDAVDDNDVDGICEELGDILMHVIMNSTIANEKGHFDFNEVARRSAEKMVRRHPHVFGSENAENSKEVLAIWESVKKEEKKNRKSTSVLDGVPRNCPALLQATKIQKKAAKYGFDWTKEEQIIEKIEEELKELKKAHAEKDDDAIDEEIGDLLFAVVNLSRFRNKLNAEDLLAAATKKFQKRFKFIEDSLAAQGRKLEDSNIQEMEELWLKAKKVK